jgi:plasmid stability protein
MTIHVRDVDPETKARLKAAAKAAGKSLSAYLREKLDEMAAKPKRRAGCRQTTKMRWRRPIHFLSRP